MQPIKGEKSLGELFSELARETGDLVRQEVTLARVEITQKVSKTAKDAGSLAVGGMVLYAGLLTLIATVIIVLGSIGVPRWLSALLVGLVVSGVGYFLVQKGMQALKKVDLAPKQTMETVKEDAEWVKEQVR